MVSISGVRGIVGSSLTPEVVVRYASAFADYAAGSPIVLGRDGRITGNVLANLASSTLLAKGCDVIALGVAPTPTIQLAVEKSGAAGGIAITASHNPIEWNGMKFIARSGLFLDARQCREFWALAANGGRPYASWEQLGQHRAERSFLALHRETVLGLPLLSVKEVRQRKLKVVLDCVNAAGGVVVPDLLRALGCDVVEMNCDVSGIFAHTPEPLPENLADLRRRVVEERADLGIAVDPDVDRLVLIDERGEPFGEEYTIASVVHFVLSKAAPGPHRVVVNLSTTRAVDDIAGKYGAEVIRTPVGEINVTSKMRELGAIVGGEGSGGVILPQVHLGRDALVGIALVLQALVEFGGTLSEFKHSMPQYSIAKGKVEVIDRSADDLIGRLADRYAPSGRITTLDGVKIDFPDSWVHVRPSNTEPIVRIIAEAPTKAAAEELVSRFSKELVG